MAFLGLVQFFHNAALMSLSSFFYPVPVSATSPLSDDVSCEDCFWREKLKAPYYIWFLKYCDSVLSKTSPFSTYDTPFPSDLSASLRAQVNVNVISIIIILTGFPVA